MSAININTQAMLSARNLDQTQDMLTRSLNRLSSGSKIVNPADDPAGFAVSGKMSAQNLRVQAASTNVQNAASYLQTTDGFMNQIGKVLARMSELNALAKDPTKSASDVSLYQQEFKALQDQLRSTIGGNTSDIGGTTNVSTPLGAFNGTTLFGSTAAPTVSIGGDVGQSVTIPTTNLRTGSMLSLIQQDSSGNYTLQSTDAGASDVLDAATQQTATLRANVGAAQSRLDLAGTNLQVQSQNLVSTISQLSDVDVAKESTNLAKYNILLQAGTAMLAQANQVPQSVLKLLQ
jgi:flagellin